MVRKAATFKQTSGGGFLFEDKVSAWFLAHIIANRNPFNEELGEISRLDFQVRVDGWLLDDFLITTSSGSKVAVSAKSNEQINAEGLKNELLSDLWSQYLQTESNVFRKDVDLFCIVNTPLPRDILNNINRLIGAAKAIDSKKLFDRITSGAEGVFSNAQKKLFDSFSCPKDLAQKYNITKEHIGGLLSRISILEFDFEFDVSKDENNLLEICKNCLLNTDGQEAQILLNKLYSYRGEKAIHGGYFDYESLIATLSRVVSLRGLNEHSHDWERINEATILKLNSIQDRIGGKVELKRDYIIKELKEKVQKNKTVFLLGRSGYGKSVLLKNLAQELKKNECKIIWIDGQNIDKGSISQSLGLKHSIGELIRKVQSPDCYLCIDGVDRFFKESQLQNIYEIISHAILPNSMWKIILTCQIDDYSDVLQRLYTVNLPLVGAISTIEKIDWKEFLQIQNHFPQLFELFKHAHLRDIFGNLKYIDLLAYNVTLKSSPAIDGSIGETDIIDWIWKEEVESGESINPIQNSRFVQLFAEKQANQLSISIPTSDFDVSDLAPLGVLQLKKILYEKEDRLYFNHDLFGDWARYKLIRANKENFKNFILSKDLLSPLWCKAVRLYGVYLLEKSQNADKWISTFEKFDKSLPNEQIIQDLLLESIFFSSSPLKYLESIWEILRSKNGIILKRFLDRFLLKATVPNPEILKIAQKLGILTVSEAASFERNPNIFYWPPVIEFIHNHKTDMIELASNRVSMIMYVWLRKTPTNFVFRREAAEVAILNAEWILHQKMQNVWVKDDLDKNAYKAFLAGVNELPDQTLNLALKLCRRVRFNNEIKDTGKYHPNSTSYHLKIRDAVQWQDGPYEPIDDQFADVCLETDAFFPFVAAQPEKTKEILLALFIDPPKEITSYGRIYYNLDINNPVQWYPPFYNRGPILYFLKTHPEQALDFVTRLINFATEQWSKSFSHKNEEVPKVEIDFSEKSIEYLGDYYVYFWYRDVGSAPHAIVSILMALEKFLIDCIDENVDIFQYVTFLLQHGRSVAFLGILNSVGKYDQRYYINVLRPFLGVFEFYNWEKMLAYGAHGVEGHQMIGSNFFSRTTWKLAKEWNELPQRKKSIHEVGLALLFHNEIIAKHFTQIISKWRLRLKETNDTGKIDPYLDNLISQFDKNNYSSEEHEGKIIYTYNEPIELTEKLKIFRQTSAASSDLTFFPGECRHNLEQGTKFTLQQIEIIWDKIHKVIDQDFLDPYHYLSPKYQYIFAGIAVLIENKSIWETEHPEYFEWIIEYTEKILEDYEVNISELDETDIGTTWGAFAARYIPIMWQSSLDYWHFRKMIGLMVLKSSYDVQKLLFLNISKFLKWSDMYFIQIQNLLLEWSSCVYSHYIDTDKKVNINTQLNELLAEFIQGKTSRALLKISDLRVEVSERPRRYYSSQDKKSLKGPGLDLSMIYHAYSSLPKFTTGVTEDEYQYLIWFWKEMVGQLVYQFGDLNEDSPEFEGYPHKFDSWVLNGVAHFILFMKPTDAHEPYWMPVFQYGGIAHHWIQHLSLAFLKVTLENKNRYDRFFLIWGKMLEYVDSCNTWKNNKVYGRDADMHFTLICLPERYMDIWDNDHNEFIERAANNIIKWMEARWMGQETIAHLMNMLRRKSSSSLIEKGMQIICRHLQLHAKMKKMPTPPGFVTREFEHDVDLARTASFLWENFKSRIKGNEVSFHSFKEIVTYLVSIQNPIGIELQDRIIQ